MSEQVFIRTRDTVVLFKGDAYPVTLSQEMIDGGWAGGQGVQWADAGESDEFRVTYSDGLYGGFLLFGSDEVSDLYTGMTGSQPAYGVGVLCAGGWELSVNTYEKYTYASRVAHAGDPLQPLVPIPYVEGQRVVFSLRGWFTTEDEWTASGDPRGANGYFIGSVVQAPSDLTSGYLTLQTSI